VSTKTADAVLTGDGLRFEVTAGSGHTIVLDSGEGDSGPRPSELLAVALAGCTGMDVISILRKKRQAVTRYALHVEGISDEDYPHAFTRFDVTHAVEGEAVDPAAVARAIELSATKYCSVGSTLAKGIPVRHGYVLRTDGQELTGEVVTLGPAAGVHAGG
jgi:putative redox protein